MGVFYERSTDVQGPAGDPDPSLETIDEPLFPILILPGTTSASPYRYTPVVLSKPIYFNSYIPQQRYHDPILNLALSSYRGVRKLSLFQAPVDLIHRDHVEHPR
jgi:hypothetical protein